MDLRDSCVLALNGGSSSIRFAFFKAGSSLDRKLHGKLDRMGQRDSTLTFRDSIQSEPHVLKMGLSLDRPAVDCFIDWLEDQDDFENLQGIGHRVVHGMRHTEPAIVTRELLDELRRISPFDPDHLPCEIGLIEALLHRHPTLRQMACFDTAFHREMPRVAKLLPIPRKYSAKGIERYGFHGISYSYLMEELRRLDPKAAEGRVVLLHLGSGASLAAVRRGKSIDTSMGFTPASGLPMGTRSGDLDPGLVSFLARTEDMNAEQFQKMVTQESGMLGISENSSDMRDLLGTEASDERAAEAVALFCYQIKKWIGSFAAALGGLDTLVFAGGIGENSPTIRARICEGLEFLGIDLLESRNQSSSAVLSKDVARVTVRLIPTDEELMIARGVIRVFCQAGRFGSSTDNHNKPGM